MKSLRNALRPRNPDPAPSVGNAEDLASLRRELTEARAELAAVSVDASELRRQTEQLLAVERARTSELAALAGIPRAKLLSHSILLEGPAVRRMQARRRQVGELIERKFSQSIGVTRCLTDDAHVRQLWERLLAFEAAGEDVLRGLPSSILDVADATISFVEGGPLRIAVGRASQPMSEVVAVPRCTYDYPTRKLHNFGHWLLDCLPQVAVLAKVAPNASFLLPFAKKGFHNATLKLLGLELEQLRPWDGSPISAQRVLALENDGRTGGGRPFSPLAEVRQLLAARGDEPSSQRHRRIFVSRRDAGASRQWVSNEADVEGLFAARGFEVVVMADCPLDQQVRMFREARVVAGVSGAGLADIVFSAPGTDVIVLMSDSHIRWYAEEEGTRSLWASDGRGKAKQLAALGDSPRFYAHLIAGFGQVCHSFVAGDRMPIDQLSDFIRDVLARVSRS
jgi:hypothetical protein